MLTYLLAKTKNAGGVLMDSIKQIWEEVEEKLSKIKESFAKNPFEMAEFERGVHAQFNRLERDFIKRTLEEKDNQIRGSLKRLDNWVIVRQDTKKLLALSGPIVFKKTLFKNKTDGHSEYLIDKILGIESHERITEASKAQILEEAVQTSYRRGGDAACVSEDKVSKETVKDILHTLRFPEEKKADLKKTVDYLYIDADEDHISLQFKKNKGDLEIGENHWKNNCVLGKIVYVYEGIEPDSPKSKRCHLKNPHYFCGVYDGDDNAKLWDAVYNYIDDNYDVNKITNIYLNADGGGWISAGKKRIDGITTVLDGFHMQKYLLKITGHLLDSADDARTKLIDIIYSGKKAKFRSEIKNIASYSESESRQKKIMEAGDYILNNWEAARIRVIGKDAVKGCSAEGHVSHILSYRMSSRPHGWSRIGADKMCRLRAYYKNGGDMLELVRYQKEEPVAAGAEYSQILSSSEILSSERNKHGLVGKYYDQMNQSLSLQTKEKLYFNSQIWTL